MSDKDFEAAMYKRAKTFMIEPRIDSGVSLASFKAGADWSRDYFKAEIGRQAKIIEVLKNGYINGYIYDQYEKAINALVNCYGDPSDPPCCDNCCEPRRIAEQALKELGCFGY